MKKFMVAMSIVALAACGAETKEEQTVETPAAEAGQPAAVEADLPNMIIARVPVDADGNELVDQVSVRMADVDASTFGNDGAAQAFANAEEANLTSELDQDSSTSSWHRRRASFYWNTPWYPGKLLGRGYSWGRNPYAYRGGYRYNYRYNGYYNRGGYRYYNYCGW